MGFFNKILIFCDIIKKRHDFLHILKTEKFNVVARHNWAKISPDQKNVFRICSLQKYVHNSILLLKLGTIV